MAQARGVRHVIRRAKGGPRPALGQSTPACWLEKQRPRTAHWSEQRIVRQQVLALVDDLGPFSIAGNEVDWHVFSDETHPAASGDRLLLTLAKMRSYTTGQDGQNLAFAE